MQAHHGDASNSSRCPLVGTVVLVGIDSSGNGFRTVSRQGAEVNSHQAYVTRLLIPHGHLARGKGSRSRIAEKERGSDEATRLRWGIEYAYPGPVPPGRAE